MTRLFRVGLAVAVALPMLAACSRDSVRVGEARLEPHGVVEVAKKNGSFRRVDKPTTIKDGSRVRVQSGTADVRLPSGELALRGGSEIVIAPQPELVAGDLLVVPEKALTVKSAGSEFAARGAARMSRGFAVTAASYTNSVAIRSAGSTLDVPALRQASVAALGQVPQQPVPLSYAADDRWDRRFLADAIDLGLELQARSESATAQFRNQGRTPGFYRTLMPQLESVPDFTSEVLDDARPPGEHLVGASIALAGKDGTFRQRWDKAFAFRGEGATWGLVAMDQGVQRVQGLVKSLDEALGRSRLPGDDRVLAAPAPRTPTSGSSATSPTTQTTQRTTPTTDDDDPPPPPPPPPTIVPETGIPIVDETVDEIEGLLPADENPLPFP